MLKRASAAVAVLALALLTGTSSVRAEGWGAIKGRVTSDGTPPKNPEVEVKEDRKCCLSKGKIHKDEWVVHPKSKGVKWAVVWLTAVGNADAKDTSFDAKKIHPKKKAIPKEAVIDIPVCKFEPRVTAMRVGSVLVVKNSSKTAHAPSLWSGPFGHSGVMMLDGEEPKTRIGQVRIEKAWRIPSPIPCVLHPWMKAWVAAFTHPYFAITNEKGEFAIEDAPVGKWRLMVWHEGAGFVQKSSKDRGVVVQITDRMTTEVPASSLKLEADD